MTLTTDAIYENGVLRPLSPLAIPEHAQVKILVNLNDDERAEWLDASRQRLTAIWDNSADDVFNDLLTP
jgi:predicted DNA-binding antitoxin AbrB/MazE fold protein